MILPFYRIGNPKRPAVLFLHGFSGRKHDFVHLVNKLPEDYCYIMLDLPGHGQALFDDNDIYSFENTLPLIKDTLAQLKIETCSVVGYSMGGRFAMNYALTYPDHVEKLLLISASPGLATAEDRAKRLEIDKGRAEDLKRHDLKHFYETWYNQAIFANLKEHPKFDNFITDRYMNNKPDYLIKAILGYSICNMRNLWAELNDFQCPIYYLVGEDDKKYLDIAKYIKLNRPNTRVTVVPGAGHTVHVEKRFETIQWLIAALKGESDS